MHVKGLRWPKGGELVAGVKKQEGLRLEGEPETGGLQGDERQEHSFPVPFSQEWGSVSRKEG